MPRTARKLVDGGIYHVLTRGNNGQAVFHDPADYEQYLRLLFTYSQANRLAVYHFALMPDHVHLLLKVELGKELSRAMLALNLSYTLFYRRRYGYHGHLWRGRFKSIWIDPTRDPLVCGREIELHPVRSKLVGHPADYPWTSYRVYASDGVEPLVVLNPAYGALGACGAERQRRYRELMDCALRAPTGSAHAPLQGREPSQDGTQARVPLPRSASHGL